MLGRRLEHLYIYIYGLCLKARPFRTHFKKTAVHCKRVRINQMKKRRKTIVLLHNPNAQETLQGKSNERGSTEYDGSSTEEEERSSPLHFISERALMNIEPPQLASLRMAWFVWFIAFIVRIRRISQPEAIVFDEFYFFSFIDQHIRHKVCSVSPSLEEGHNSHVPFFLVEPDRMT